MKIAICDDEQDCIDDIIKHLDAFSCEHGIDFENFVYQSAEKMIELKMKFDIAILDVEMEGMNGIELGESLRKLNPHIILIYVTAHKKYLDDALNLNAVRFFEKPIDAQRFYKGLSDSIKRMDTEAVDFYLKDGKNIVRINKQDIVYIEIEKRRTRVITINRDYSSNYTINDWIKVLPSNIFTSPHKSYVINLNFVTAYERSFVTLNNQVQIPIARSRQIEFKELFFHFMEGK